MDSIETCSSEKISQEELCQSPSLKFACRKTCGLCSDTPKPVNQPIQPVKSVPVQNVPVSQPMVQYARVGLKFKLNEIINNET